MGPVTQTLATVLLFVLLLAAVPFLLRRLKARQSLGLGAAGGDSRIISVLAVGPQQRVVTVEVGPAHARTWLVLGVTPQSVNCLHQVAPQPEGATGKADVPAVAVPPAIPEAWR